MGFCPKCPVLRARRACWTTGLLDYKTGESEFLNEFAGGVMPSDIFACPVCSGSIVLASYEHGPGFAVSIPNGTPGELLETLPRGWTRHPCALWGEPAVKARRKRPRWLTVLVGGRK